MVRRILLIIIRKNGKILKLKTKKKIIMKRNNKKMKRNNSNIKIKKAHYDYDYDWNMKKIVRMKMIPHISIYLLYFLFFNPIQNESINFILNASIFKTSPLSSYTRVVATY